MRALLDTKSFPQIERASKQGMRSGLRCYGLLDAAGSSKRAWQWLAAGYPVEVFDGRFGKPKKAFLLLLLLLIDMGKPDLLIEAGAAAGGWHAFAVGGGCSQEAAVPATPFYPTHGLSTSPHRACLARAHRVLDARLTLLLCERRAVRGIEGRHAARLGFLSWGERMPSPAPALQRKGEIQGRLINLLSTPKARQTGETLSNALQCMTQSLANASTRRQLCGDRQSLARQECADKTETLDDNSLWALAVLSRPR